MGGLHRELCRSVEGDERDRLGNERWSIGSEWICCESLPVLLDVDEDEFLR